VLQPHERDWWDAWNLRAALDQGVRLQPLAAPVPLDPGEVCYAIEPCEVLRFHGIRLAFGSSNGHAAAAQWRRIDIGTALLTQHRILMLSDLGSQSFGLVQMRRMWTEHDGVVVVYGEDHYKLRPPRPVWFDVLLNEVAFNRRLDLEVPSFVIAAWRRAGLV
jgi:hypothetical protein